MPLDLEVSLDASQDLNSAVTSFCQTYRELARQQLQAALQARIEALEAAWCGARQIRSKCFATPVALWRGHWPGRVKLIDNRLIDYYNSSL